jgi:hypothetical protein
MSESERSLTDPIQLWIDDLKNLSLQARAKGSATQEPFLFNELIPRIQKLAELIMEEPPGDEEEILQIQGEQTVMLRFTTASNLRTWLPSIETPEALELFLQLESDLTGADPEEIKAQLAAAIEGQAAAQLLPKPEETDPEDAE